MSKMQHMPLSCITKAYLPCMANPWVEPLTSISSGVQSAKSQMSSLFSEGLNGFWAAAREKTMTATGNNNNLFSIFIR